MAQVLAMDVIHHEHLSPLSTKRDSSVLSSGRGGSGNIRRSYISTAIDLFSPRERQSTLSADPADLPRFWSTLPIEPHEVEKKQVTSSGRGGSGNIQRTVSGLETHPLTAFILRQHEATQAQYEQRVREVHAEANVIRSSGRGGSGNISNPRRRNSEQELRTGSKRHFFTTKGRERAVACTADGAAQGLDGRGCSADKRASRATHSSGTSGGSDTGAMDSDGARDERQSSMIRDSPTSDILGSEDAPAGHFGRRQSLRSLFRLSKRLSSTTSLVTMSPPSSPKSPTSPRSVRSAVMSRSSRRLSSPASISVSVADTLEEQAYVSFLEM